MFVYHVNLIGYLADSNEVHGKSRKNLTLAGSTYKKKDDTRGVGRFGCFGFRFRFGWFVFFSVTYLSHPFKVVF